MKRQYRYGTFETASSAIHSLVISKDGLEPSDLPVKKGVLRVPLVPLEREHVVFATQLDKLSFIISWVWYYFTYHCSSARDEGFEHFYMFEDIDAAICEYDERISEIKVYKPRGVELSYNHQFYDEISYGDVPYVNIYDDESVQNFVFNKYIAVTLGSD